MIDAPARRWGPVATAVLVAAVGLALRLWLAISTHGSNDIDYWHGFAASIEEHGLIWCYQNIPHFNHPPLLGYFSVLMFKAERVLHLPFDVGLKLFPIAADVATGFLLFRIWRARSAWHATLAVALFALSLDSLLVTGYHGNTDAALAFLVLLSAYLLDRSRFFLAGLALGAAINVKLVPVLLIPLLAMQCRRPRDLLVFAGALSLCALPFAPVVLTNWASFSKNVFAYNSSANRWGLYGLLQLGGETRNISAYTNPLLPLFWHHGRYFILASVILVGGLGRIYRRWSAQELAALGVLAFLVFAPGFGIQYTVHAVPVLFAVSLGRGFIYSCLAGFFALVVYLEFWTGAIPYQSFFSGHFAFVAVLLGVITWTFLVATACALLSRSRPVASV